MHIYVYIFKIHPLRYERVNCSSQGWKIQAGNFILVARICLILRLHLPHCTAVHLLYLSPHLYISLTSPPSPPSPASPPPSFPSSDAIRQKDEKNLLLAMRPETFYFTSFLYISFCSLLLLGFLSSVSSRCFVLFGHSRGHRRHHPIILHTTLYSTRRCTSIKQNDLFSLIK